MASAGPLLGTYYLVQFASVIFHPLLALCGCNVVITQHYLAVSHGHVVQARVLRQWPQLWQQAL